MAVITAVGSGTGGATTLIGEVKGISMSGITATEIDTSILSSTNKTCVLGTMDGGTITIEFNAVGDGQHNMPNFGSNTPTGFVIRFGSTTPNKGITVSFTGYIIETSFSAGVDESVTGSYTIQMSSAPEIATTVTPPQSGD